MFLVLSCYKLGDSNLYFLNEIRVSYFLCTSSANMVKLRDFIFGTVMHQYWVLHYYTIVVNILKI